MTAPGAISPNATRPIDYDVPENRAAWAAVTVLALIGIVAWLDRQVLSLLVEPLKHDLNISDTQIGILQGFSFVLFYALAGIPLGYAVDRYSRRLIIFLGVLGWSAATVLSGFAHSFGELLVARFFVGLGEAALTPAAYSILSDMFPRRRFALAMSIFNMGLLLGSIVALVVSGLVIANSRHGLNFPIIGWRNVWQSTFIVIGAPGALFSFLIYFIPEPTRRLSLAANGTTRALLTFLRSRWRFLTLHFLGFSLLMSIAHAVGAWAPAVMQRTYGWSIQQVSVGLAVAFTIAGVGGVTANGKLVDDWFGRGVTDAHFRYYVWGGLILAAAGLACAGAPTGILFVAAMIPIKMLINFGGVSAAAVSVVTPSELRGRLASIYLFFVNIIGVSLGPAGVAWITEDVFHDHKKVGVALGLFVTLAALGASALLLLGLRPMRDAVTASEQSSPKRQDHAAIS